MNARAFQRFHCDKSGRWEHFEHVADVGVRGIGPSCEIAFEQAALAMTAVVTEPASVRCSDAVDVTCEAPDLDLLLVDWLNAVIYEMATRRMLFARFAVTIVGSRLHGTAWGESVSARRHEPVVEVKGATYTALRVAREQDEWIAQCVIDV